MPFINTLYKYLVVLGVVFLAACSANTPKDDVEEELPVIEGEAAVGGEAPAFVLIPNPYTPGNVPEQAKREYAKVKELMLAKKWKQAVGLLSLMVETYPTLSGPYINLGIAYHQLEQLENSEKALKFAIETNAQNLDAYTQLGFLYREMGRFDEAEESYKKALAIWPHHLPSTTNLGILYDLYMGRFDDALVYYELSQNISGGENRQLKGWIVDLKRRMGEK